MDKWILNLNHIIFWWYYKKASEHFRGYTFFKSVSLLRQNYEHLKYQYKQLDELHGKCIKTDSELRAEISNLKIQRIATDKQIRWANENFGTNWTPPTDN